MRYYLLLCSLFFISLVGCKKTAKVSIPGEIISISPVSDPGTLNISDYLTDIRFIPLQTNDSCLLSSTLNLKVNDNRIYIQTSRQSYISMIRENSYPKSNIRAVDLSNMCLLRISSY